jgi:two-component system response regulator HydG
LLVNHFLRRYGQRHGRPGCQLDAQALDCLLRYPFPGNVRELENAIERSVVLAAGPLIASADLPPEIETGAGLPPLDTLPRSNEELKEAKRAARDEAQLRVERRFLVGLLQSTGGNVTRAAEQAGMNRSLLQQMLARHGLGAENFRQRQDDRAEDEADQ